MGTEINRYKDMIETIEKYFTTLTDKQREQLEAIGRLYPEWNEKINVISRKDIGNLWVNHILHSLALVKFIDPTAGTRMLDMGTGGGFPGIPMAIMLPECRFHLIDRIGKKVRVAKEIADAIGLENVTFQHGDIGECHDRYDFVVSRAVMRLDALVPLVRRNVAKENHNRLHNGLGCLKGGDLKDELDETKAACVDQDVAVFLNETYFETKKIIYVPL